MSSNIRLKSTCDFCGNEFIAKTTKTRYCSHTCNSRDYKARKKKIKIGSITNSKKNETQISHLNILNSKDYLTVHDVSLLMGCSTRTVYRLIQDGTIKATNLSARLTRINRGSLEKIIPK